MRLRHIPGSEEQIAESIYVVQAPEEKKGRWAQVFENENPIQVEVGMGKGKFLLELAKKNPDRNFVGVERYSTVLLKAIQKQEDLQLPNICFLRVDAEQLGDIFEKGEVEKIYLNFSDPWPKDRHAKRRLPSRQFLARYEQFLRAEGDLEFKTDNRGLFEFALEELSHTDWKIRKMTYDLHHDEEMAQGNVMTEYEERFSSMGNPIYKYVISRI